jgi:hypothetical protein
VEVAIEGLLKLGSEESRVQLETYMLSLEIEKVSGMLPAADAGGRRYMKRGGGEITKRAFSWLMSKIMATRDGAAAAAPETTEALKQLGTELAKVPTAARKSVDAAAAKAVLSAVPVASTLGSLAPAAVGLAGASYLSNHPSLVVGVGDLAARISLSMGSMMGALGPQWPKFIAEMKSVGVIAGNAVATAAYTVADRPYLIAAIAYVLLAEYAKTTESKTVYKLIATSTKEIASKMQSAAATASSALAKGAADRLQSGVKEGQVFVSDVNSVVSAQINAFYGWLNTNPALKDLGDEIKKAIAERERIAIEQAYKTARDKRAEGRATAALAAAAQKEAAEALGAVAPFAPGSSGNEGAASPVATGGRRLTSRRRRRAAYLPRQTRRSSFGRRRGYSRRRRE